MDFQEKKVFPNPRVDANPISTLFFCWINPIFRKGYRNTLDLNDLYDALKEDGSDKLGSKLERNWENQLKKSKQNGKPAKLYKAIASTFWKIYVFLLIGLLIDECVIRVAQPLFLKYTISSFSDGSETWEQYLYATGVCITALLHTLVLQPSMFSIQHVGMKCRVAVCSLIYRKCLRLSKAAQGKTTVGQMVNLLSNDVIRFDTNLLFIGYLFIGPLQMGILGYFLWDEVGDACFAGIAFVVFLVPIEFVIGRMFTKYRFKIAQKTDERGRIMNEIIIAIRVIKMYAWEKPFSLLVNKVRGHEVKELKMASFFRALHLSFYISSARLVTYFVFLTYILQGNALTADRTFFVLTIFNTIRQVMLSYWPTAAAAVGELFVSMGRIETFLKLEDHSATEHVEIIPEPTDKTMSIFMSNVDARWSKENERLTLNKLNLDLKGDTLVTVCGPVGCGKTSFLHAILAELPITGGTCRINGTTAYASQEPWIFAGNVKQNILFGAKYDEARYKQVVYASALEDDFNQLPYGDRTIVGERGVALSGGQKARVNLARALYQKADIYLLDDPLSAVDSKVSRHLFEKCMKKHLTGHLRILCTHQLQYLPQSDHIIVLDNGEISAQGTYDELVAKGIDFVSLMVKENEDEKDTKPEVQQVTAKPDDKKQEEKGKPAQQGEKMVGGSVTAGTYWEYFQASETNLGIFMLFSIFIISQLLFTAADYWLSFWTRAEGNRIDREEEATSKIETINPNFTDFNGTPNLRWTPKDDDGYLGEELYFWIYTGIVIAIFITVKARAIYFFMFSVNVSRNIHNNMFANMVRAPTKFFDENPSGRIMNRFTKDIGALDELLPFAFFDAITIFLLLVSMVILIVIANYYIIIPTALLMLSLYFIRRYYISTARDVKRIEAITRSPLFTHVVASIQGLTTIRSAHNETTLVKQFDDHQNLHSSAWFTFISANRWFAIWLELISVGYLSIVTYSFMILQSVMSFESADVGLAISSALSLTGVFQWGMRQSAETENQMTSAERAFEYCKLESEAPLESKPDKKPPKDWPNRGEIRFENMYLAYEEKDVLKGLTFNIKAKEKIGIVGRTGAGKSSIIAGFFRMTEPKGNVLIDGVNITEIGLHDLRTKISIIPQDPVLFSGTMRYNLDPFSQFDDKDLWQVLEEVELKNDIPALDFKVSDGGNNFSVGQRQLVCLARAILRKNKIIVLDEATANVDPRTDNFIQSTIRTKFSECTIITIAHRLHSVMDCDRILVLDNGYLKEYDHPHVLLQSPHGILSSMVEHTGKASATILRQVAADTFHTKRPSFSRGTLHDIRQSITEEQRHLLDALRKRVENE